MVSTKSLQDFIKSSEEYNLILISILLKFFMFSFFFADRWCLRIKNFNLNDVRNVFDIMSRNRIDVSRDKLAQYGRIFKQANITSDQYPKLIQSVWIL